MMRSIVLLALLGVACGEGELDYAVCDVREPSCIESISALVAKRRASSAVEVPPVEFTTRAERIAETRIDAISPELEARYARYHRGYAPFGLYPEGYTVSDQVSDLVGSVPAFYDGSRKTIVIVTDIGTRDMEQSYLTMVHEMVHAQQDAELDLGELSETHGTTADRRLGLRAIVEGEAITFELDAAVTLDGFTVNEIDWSSYFEDWQRLTRERYSESEVPDLMTSRLFPYSYGGEMVFDRWLAEDRPGIDALFRSPPTSTRQVMAWPETEPPGDRWNGDGTLNPEGIPDLGPDWEIINWANDGLWLVWAMMERLGATAQPETLSALSSDLLTVLYNPTDDSVLAVWRLQFDEDASVDDLRATLTTSLSGVEGFVLDDGDVVLVAGDAPERVTAEIRWRSVTDVRAEIEDQAAPRETRDIDRHRWHGHFRGP